MSCCFVKSAYHAGLLFLLLCFFFCFLPVKKKKTNWKECGRLKANRKVSSSCRFFFCFFPFSFSLGKWKQSTPEKNNNDDDDYNNKCREDVYISLGFGDLGQKAYIRQQGFPFPLDSRGIFYLIHGFEIKQKVI